MPLDVKNLDDTSSPSKGSKSFPYKLAIIGGGPSGCSVIVRAVRTGNISKLCEADEGSRLAGVCLIDKCSLARFGGGRLQDYAINSNTFAVKFATNVLDEKLDSIPPETCAESYFEKIGTSDNCNRLKEYGNKQGSLKVVGGFLHDVGISVVETLSEYPSTCSCIMETTVNAIQRYQRDDGMIGWRLSISAEGKENILIFSKDVLFATGGRQETPVLANSFHNSKVLSSDFVCTDEGIEEVRTRILKSIRSTGKHKVVIVGGSHSAFSAAWMCLHKLDLQVREGDAPAPVPAPLPVSVPPATVPVNPCESETTSSPKSITSPVCATVIDDGASIDTSISPPEQPASSSPENATHLALSTPVAAPVAVAVADSTPPSTTSVSTSTTTLVSTSCKERRERVSVMESCKSGNNDVLILHRSYIKVFYSSKREADYDSYFDIGVVSKSTGQIHPFGGLRGDSKALWRDIKSGREGRVRLVSLRNGVDVTQQSLGTKVFDEAAVIVWACGYSTNACPVYQSDGVTLIPLCTYRGQVEVDDLARVLTAQAPEEFPSPSPSPPRCKDRHSPSPPCHANKSSPACSMKSNDDVWTGAAYTQGSDDRTDRDGDFESLSGKESLDTAEMSSLRVGTSRSYDSSAGPAVCSGVESSGSEESVNPRSAPVTVTIPTQKIITPVPKRKSSVTPVSTVSALFTPLAPSLPAPVFAPVGGLLGSGLGFGLKATLDNGEADGSSGRADGVAVYLKHGATLVLAHVLGPSVYGDGISSWEGRNAAMKKLQHQHPPASKISSREEGVGSDTEGLDNAYCHRVVSKHYSASRASRSPNRSPGPTPSFSQYSPRGGRRKSDSTYVRCASPSPSSPPVQLVHPMSTSAPVTARPSAQLDATQHVRATRSSASPETSFMSRNISPSTIRTPVNPDQQAAGVDRLSAPRTAYVAKSKEIPPTVMLDGQALKASVCRLSLSPAQMVVQPDVLLPVKPAPRRLSKGTGIVSGTTAASPTVSIRKPSTSGKEKPSQAPPSRSSTAVALQTKPIRSMPPGRPSSPPCPARRQYTVQSEVDDDGPKDKGPDHSDVAQVQLRTSPVMDKSPASVGASPQGAPHPTRKKPTPTPPSSALKGVVLQLDLPLNKEVSRILRSTPLSAQTAPEEDFFPPPYQRSSSDKTWGGDRTRHPIEPRTLLMSLSPPPDFADLTSPGPDEFISDVGGVHMKPIAYMAKGRAASKKISTDASFLNKLQQYV